MALTSTQDVRCTGATRALASLLLAVGLASPASAQLAQVYLTYGPDDTGPLSGWAIAVPAGQTITAHLWVQGGGIASVPAPCELGAIGTEICGVNLLLDGGSDFVWNDFQVDPNRPFDSSGSGIPVVANPSNGLLKLNALDLAPAGLGNRYLGAVTITADPGANPETTAQVSGGVIGSNLSMRSIETRSIVVPEPGLVAGLAVGGLALGLARGRSRGVRPNASRAAGIASGKSRADRGSQATLC